MKSLPDEALDTHTAQAAKAPSELSLMHLYLSTEPSIASRRTQLRRTHARRPEPLVIAGIDSDPKQADALKRWGRAYWGRQ